jgi:hypothetical protein
VDRERHDPVIKSPLIEAAIGAAPKHTCSMECLGGYCPEANRVRAREEMSSIEILSGGRLKPVTDLDGLPVGGTMRLFETGATRDTDTGKYDYEAFLSPLVIEGYGAYMHKNRRQKDGTLRDGDNWQKGIPLATYMKSTWRHFFAMWKAHRSGLPFTDQQIDETFAILFNVSGYLHEILKARKTA